MQHYFINRVRLVCVSRCSVSIGVNPSNNDKRDFVRGTVGVVIVFMRDARARHEDAFANAWIAATWRVARIVLCVVLTALLVLGFLTYDSDFAPGPLDAADANADAVAVVGPLHGLSGPACPSRARAAAEGGAAAHPHGELDAPRAADEAEFCHVSPAEPAGDPSRLALLEPARAFAVASRAADGVSVPLPPDVAVLQRTIEALHAAFAEYDGAALASAREPASADASARLSRTIPVLGTMCIGVDCGFVPLGLQRLGVGIGHVIVVVSTAAPRHVAMFSALERAFPGRFTKLHRPQKLSCAESWNAIARLAFSIRPMPAYVFFANADWHPRPVKQRRDSSGSVPLTHMHGFAEWTATHAAEYAVVRFLGFSAFALTRRGYLELGYFDEVIYPAYGEDVEFVLRAASKGEPLGQYRTPGGEPDAEVHAHQGSASRRNREAVRRTKRMSRYDYLRRKWGIYLPHFTGYEDALAKARPHAHPFGIPVIKHANSWAVDASQRRCIQTGEGVKMYWSHSCWYNMNVLKTHHIVPSSWKFDDELTTLNEHRS